MKIWIFSYHFPPHATIGGRRWVKFAKAFHRMGHNVTVFSTRAPKGSRSPWDEDLKGLRVLRLPYRYPRILDRVPRTILEKLHYKLALAFLRLFFKGNVYDRAIAWRKVLMRVVGMVKSHEGLPDVIFANGPPFRVLVYACALKLLYPSIKVVCDFRDPWTWWFNMGYLTLSPQDKAVEKELEQAVVNLADKITAPNPEMLERLKMYAGIEHKLALIPHAFDEDEFPKNLPSREPRVGPIRLLFFGTIYPEIRAQLLSLYSRVKAVDSEAIFDIFSEDGALGIPTHRPVSAPELFSKFQEYDYAVLLVPAPIRNQVTSKAIELAFQDIPVLLVSESGRLSKFSQSAGLGIWLHPKNCEQQIEDIVRSRRRMSRENRSKDLCEYTLPYLAAAMLT